MSTLYSAGAVYPPFSLGSIDTSGNSTTYHINVNNFANHAIQFTIADISNNVVVRMQGSIDGTNWFNMDSADTTVTTNGTYVIHSVIPTVYIRLYFVSRDTALLGSLSSIYYYGST